MTVIFYKIVCPVLGFVLLFFTYYLFRNAQNFVKNGNPIKAKVIKVNPGANGRFYPVFGYDINGAKYSGTIKHASPKWGGKEGTMHTIIYNIMQPEKIKVASVGGLFLTPMVLSCFSAICFILFIWFVWFQKSIAI